MTKEQLVEFLMSRGITKEETELIVLIAELGGLRYEKVWEYYKDYPDFWEGVDRD